MKKEILKVGILCMRENIESTTQEAINPCESGWTFFQVEVKCVRQRKNHFDYLIKRDLLIKPTIF